MRRPSTNRRTWTYHEANRAIPYLRRCLASLREHHVAASCKNPCGSRGFHQAEEAVARQELQALGVRLHGGPLRGVALLPMRVDRPSGGRAAPAFWVYRDSRPAINSFAFADVLTLTDDLPQAELPIPDAWKTGPALLPHIPSPVPRCHPG